MAATHDPALLVAVDEGVERIDEVGLRIDGVEFDLPSGDVSTVGPHRCRQANPAVVTDSAPDLGWRPR
jgi:hypothetical protein